MLRALGLALSFLTRRERTILFALIGLRAFTGLLDALGIALIGFIASVAAVRLSPHSAPVEILGIRIPALDTGQLFAVVLVVLAVFVLKAVTAIALVRNQSTFIARVESRNADEMIAFVLESPLEQIKRFSGAELQFALTASTTYAFTGLLNNMGTLIAEGFLLLVVTATLVVVNPAVALFTLLYFSLVVVLIQVFIGRSVKRASHEAIGGTVSSIEQIDGVLETFREITVLRKQPFFSSRISASRRRIAGANATLTFLAGMPRYIVETALLLGVVVLVAQQFLGGDAADGLVTIGVFLTGGVRMMASLLPVQSAVANIKQNSEQGRAALNLLVEIRDAAGADSTDDDSQDPVSRAIGPEGLSVDIRNANFRYAGAEVDTLRDVSLRIEPGSHVAIIGDSGAGKSTLVDLMLGLIEPTRGSVSIAGEAPKMLRNRFPGIVAYVPQRPGMVVGTIADNVALGVEAAQVDSGRLADVLASAHLATFIAGLPKGVDSSIGMQADALSGGQIQRVGVARALYTSPRLIVLDEATSGLDAGSEQVVIDQLRALHGRTTVVVIAHRLSTVQHADLVHVVEGGRIVASGDFATVRASNPTVENYVRLMSFDEPAAAAGGDDHPRRP